MLLLQRRVEHTHDGCCHVHGVDGAQSMGGVFPELRTLCDAMCCDDGAKRPTLPAVLAALKAWACTSPYGGSLHSNHCTTEQSWSEYVALDAEV